MEGHAPRFMGHGAPVQGLGVEGLGLGFRVQGSGFGGRGGLIIDHSRFTLEKRSCLGSLFFKGLLAVSADAISQEAKGSYLTPPKGSNLKPCRSWPPLRPYSRRVWAFARIEG